MKEFRIPGLSETIGGSIGSVLYAYQSVHGEELLQPSLISWNVVSWHHIPHTRFVVRVQVPFESLRRTTRDRKYLLDELENVLVSLKPATETRQGAADPNVMIPSVLARLEGLKRKVGYKVCSMSHDLQVH